MAKASFGAVLRLAVAPGSPVAVANLNSITPPAFTRAVIDATTHDSAGGAMESISEGVYDPGEMTIGGDWIMGSGGDDLFISSITAGSVLSYELVGKGASAAEQDAGQCIVTAYTPGALDVTGKQTFTATLKVTGERTQGADA